MFTLRFLCIAQDLRRIEEYARYKLINFNNTRKKLWQLLSEEASYKLQGY
jgi:hypothetical protein